MKRKVPSLPTRFYRSQWEVFSTSTVPHHDQGDFLGLNGKFSQLRWFSTLTNGDFLRLHGKFSQLRWLSFPLHLLGEGVRWDMWGSTPVKVSIAHRLRLAPV